MRRPVLRPNRFAEWFNRVAPGAYRQITAEDVLDMTQCGLIGRYGEYMQLDIETVRGILRYEQLRRNRQKRADIRDSDDSIHCRSCGVVLTKPDGRRGRPREYCRDCETSRSTMRGRKRRRKMRAAMN